MNDEIVVVISATDGVENRILPYEYPFFYRTNPILVSSVCGRASTIVRAPELGLLERPVNMPDTLMVNEPFTSESQACPISSHELRSGSEFYELTDRGQDGYEVFLKSQYLD